MARITQKRMAEMGAAAMRKLRSTAESVVFPLMAGPKRKKDLELSTLGYLAMAETLARKLSRNMERAGLPPADGQVFVATSDVAFSQLRNLYHVSSHPTHELMMLDTRLRSEASAIIGLVVSVWDGEKRRCLAFPPVHCEQPRGCPLASFGRQANPRWGDTALEPS